LLLGQHVKQLGPVVQLIEDVQRRWIFCHIKPFSPVAFSDQNFWIPVKYFWNTLATHSRTDVCLYYDVQTFSKIQMLSAWYIYSEYYENWCLVVHTSKILASLSWLSVSSGNLSLHGPQLKQFMIKPLTMMVPTKNQRIMKEWPISIIYFHALAGLTE